MPRTKIQNKEIKEATANKIKEAGLKLFSHKGLIATSISDIAALANVSVGLMYHYYRSKEELYAELIGTAISAANSSFREALEQDIAPLEKLKLLVKNILDDSMKNDQTSQNFLLMTQALLNTNLPDKAQEYMKDVYISFDIVKKIIVAGQQAGEVKEGNPELLTTLILSAINGLCTYKLIMGDRFVAPSPNMLLVLLTK